MEGLLPLVYKSIKKNRTRRHYEYLSSGSAAQSYNNVTDNFYVNDYNKQQEMVNSPSLEKNNIGLGHGHGGTFGVEGSMAHMNHRRHNSIHVDYLGRFSPDPRHEGNSRKLVRFRSHRLFSCVTGV